MTKKFWAKNVSNLNLEQETIEDSNNIYGKQTKYMIEHDIGAYQWEKTMGSFEANSNYDSKPKISLDLEGCKDISEFFHYFLDKEMVNLIVLNTNIKLIVYKASRPSKSKLKNNY